MVHENCNCINANVLIEFYLKEVLIKLISGRKLFLDNTTVFTERNMSISINSIGKT